MSDGSNTLIDSISEDSDGDTPTSRQSSGREVLRYVMLAVMSVVIGLLLSVALVALIDSFWLIVAGTVLGWVLLRSQPTVSGTVGTGLYAAAVLAVLVPIGQYAPRIFYIEGQTPPGGWTALGGIIGLLVGSVVAIIVALILVAIGYVLRRRSARKAG